MESIRNLEFHHVCHRIAPGSLEFIIELFELLGCTVSYRPNNHRWAMLAQPEKPIDIQLVESEESIIPTGEKIQAHIAFLATNAKKEVKKLEQWITSRGKKFVTGGWNAKERWFDLPEIFGDFVIEVMDRSVVE